MNNNCTSIPTILCHATLVKHPQAMCASVIKPYCPHVLRNRKLVQQIGAKEDGRRASRKEYLEEEESLQRHVGNRGSKSLKCIVKSIAYANTTSEAGRFCGCGRKRREGYGFAEVSELCPGIVKN
jgi:hypothetical protein